ncbi:MAG: amidase [Xanthomonadales bacterium]|jgi:aspartyl-tRNA(Asn)/glutamyl-tRNA(Gln) amidotransferase subunit A|nr:amidase [Xanthomonadales bacterium]
MSRTSSEPPRTVPEHADAHSDPTFWSLKKAAAAIARKSISSRELTEACLNRIAKHDPFLNTFITLTAEQALQAARQMDAERARDRQRSPLHGIPLVLKDNIDTDGIRTTAASALFADRVPTADAEIWRRLRAGGSVLLGKSNLHEFAAGSTNAVSHFGPVRNPWAPDRHCGGSSGGCAVAVIANFCFGAVGTDTGGSNRTPASYCGVTGFKPTYGRSSMRGIIPVSASLDHVGPITRSAEDAALMLDLMAGHDPLDPDSVAHPPGFYARAISAAVDELRIGVPQAFYADPIDAEVLAAVNAALHQLEKLTRGRVDIALPAQAFGGMSIQVEMAAYHQPWYPSQADRYQAATRKKLQRANETLATTYIAELRNMRLLRHHIHEWFKTVDILVTPTTRHKPERFADISPDSAVKREVPPSNTFPFNLLGLPTLSIPCGQFTDGIPIGLQITGAPWAEAQVLALAHAYEQHTHWHARRPPLALLQSCRAGPSLHQTESAP